MSKVAGNKEHAEQAAEALSDLNTLYAILYLTENSLLRSKSANRAGDKINAICKTSAQKELEKYDRHMARITP